MALLVFVSAAFIAVASSTPVNPGLMNLFLMPDFAKSDGAVCLDGSPGGFYFRPATSANHTNDWVLHFKGAGWCYDEEDCVQRSQMQFGSSKYWPTNTSGWNGGILSPNDEQFGMFNKVVLLYCDGASFTGDREEPVHPPAVNGGPPPAPLYFRGKRIMEAILKTLQRDHNLGNADNILLTGCSSGGLAAYLHADTMSQALSEIAPGLKKFRSAPHSGFFLMHNSVEGLPVYPDQMKYIFELSNSTGGVNPACVSAMPSGDAWKCMFAQNSYAHTSVPTFVENSALDMWQTGCIFCASPVTGFPKQTTGVNGNCSSAPGWRACSNQPENCTASQMTTMNGYLHDFVNTVKSIPTFAKPGNGAFLHSCHTHCEALSGPWSLFKINNVTMKEAVHAWWLSDGSDPSSKHTFLPCTYKTTSPHQCNPTCN
eukprot:m.2485 g.2485  ORF g.2485 m.2485 type:complete len:427 (+) comp2528_c0_seq2:42-1322(+)